jgi:hypothetical protein
MRLDLSGSFDCVARIKPRATSLRMTVHGVVMWMAWGYRGEYRCAFPSLLQRPSL